MYSVASCLNCLCPAWEESIPDWSPSAPARCRNDAILTSLSARAAALCCFRFFSAHNSHDDSALISRACRIVHRPRPLPAAFAGTWGDGSVSYLVDISPQHRQAKRPERRPGTSVQGSVSWRLANPLASHKCFSGQGFLRDLPSGRKGWMARYDTPGHSSRESP
jgi:hypothetical protein